jgi:hypothetical protein
VVEDGFGTEVEEKADFEASAAEIVVQLPGSSRVQLKGGFCFDDELGIDNEVEPLPGNLKAFVHYRDTLLSPNVVPTIQQLVLQRAYVNMFQKAEAERVVYLKERSNS